MCIGRHQGGRVVVVSTYTQVTTSLKLYAQESHGRTNVRKCENWLKSFIEYGQTGEAPDQMLFWTGVSTISGALGRKCYFDQTIFKWYANMYVVLVAPPGIISKTTCASLGMNLLKQVDDVHFGPNVVTWQSLVGAFQKSHSVVEVKPDQYEDSHSLNISSGELGNLLSTNDREMMDLLVTLWDCASIHKQTKKDGDEKLDNPFLNLIACTTPGWISGNIPMYMIEGGLVSRTVFVYGDSKRQYIAYPGLQQNRSASTTRIMEQKLVDDLRDIAKLSGEFGITQDALAYGEKWYEQHYKSIQGVSDSRFGGYFARKQTHIHKLAMVLSAARGSDLTITLADMEQAVQHVTDLEKNMPLIFDRIGKSEASSQADRLVDMVRGSPNPVPTRIAYKFVHNYFPRYEDYLAVLKGLQRSGEIVIVGEGEKACLTVPKIVIPQPA
jgi:hypothetical protein